MPDTPDHLGRAVAGTGDSPPTLVFTVPSGETWQLGDGYVVNDSSGIVLVTLYRTLSGDPTAPPPQASKFSSTTELQPRQVLFFGRGTMFPALSSLYIQASVGSAIVINCDGVKRT